MTVEWIPVVDRINLFLNWRQNRHEVFLDGPIYTEFIGARIAYAIRAAIEGIVIAVIPVGMAPMSEGAISRVFSKSAADIRAAGYDGSPVLVSIPASKQSHWKAGFILQSTEDKDMEHQREQDDAGVEALTQRDLQLQPERDNRTVNLSKKWAQVLKESMADRELGALSELPRWHSRAQSICIAQIKWAPVGIGYMCPINDEQVIHSIMLASLIGEIVWTDLDHQGNLVASFTNAPRSVPLDQEGWRETIEGPNNGLALSSLRGCVEAVAELLHTSLLPMASAEYARGILSDGSLGAWEMLKRDNR